MLTEGRRAVVGGGSRGIGKAPGKIAATLARTASGEAGHLTGTTTAAGGGISPCPKLA